MADQIDEYVKRPRRYENIDGLGELFFGILWMALLLLIYFDLAAPSGSSWHHEATFLSCIAALAVAYLYGYKALKSRITYPRTGYVKYRPYETMIAIAGLAAIAIAIATALVLRHLEPYSSETVKMALASAGWGLFYAFTTRMEAAWRWAVLVALLVVPPAATMLFPVGRFWAGTFPFVLQGVIFAVSGTIALNLYVRQNPRPEQVAE
jgi:hypothetical protein